MAIQINLLPWREEKREYNKKVSVGFLIAGAITALMLAGVAYYLIQVSIANQESNFSILNMENNKVLKNLAIMKDLEIKRELLNKQIVSIEKLQDRRGDIAHLIESLSNNVMDKDLFLTKFDFNYKEIKIDGIARNEKIVADFMSGLTSSGWFVTPELINMKSAESLGGG